MQTYRVRAAGAARSEQWSPKLAERKVEGSQELAAHLGEGVLLHAAVREEAGDGGDQEAGHAREEDLRSYRREAQRLRGRLWAG